MVSQVLVKQQAPGSTWNVQWAWRLENLALWLSWLLVAEQNSADCSCVPNSNEEIIFLGLFCLVSCVGKTWASLGCDPEKCLSEINFPVAD